MYAGLQDVGISTTAEGTGQWTLGLATLPYTMPLPAEYAISEAMLQEQAAGFLSTLYAVLGGDSFHNDPNKVRASIKFIWSCTFSVHNKGSA